MLGFAQTLPQINQWTHGTQITAAHGHFAFFGAFGMLVLAAIYFMAPSLKGWETIHETRGKWSFWLMSLGMIGIVFSFLVAGVLNVYLVRMTGLDFMIVRDQYLRFWIGGVFLSGLLLFLPGLTLYVLDFFSLSPSTPVNASQTLPARANASKLVKKGA
jgi:nitric oxide reductase subunit B